MKKEKKEINEDIGISLILWIAGAIVILAVIIAGITKPSMFSPDFIALGTIIFLVGGSIIFALFSISSAIANSQKQEKKKEKG